GDQGGSGVPGAHDARGRQERQPARVSTDSSLADGLPSGAPGHRRPRRRLRIRSVVLWLQGASGARPRAPPATDGRRTAQEVSSEAAVLDGTWYCDGWDPNLKILHRIRATLYDRMSAYQRIQVLDTYEFGRVLVIDGLPQAAESDEGVYARAVAWPPLLARRGARVLITGGGDGHV